MIICKNHLLVKVIKAALNEIPDRVARELDSRDVSYLQIALFIFVLFREYLEIIRSVLNKRYQCQRESFQGESYGLQKYFHKVGKLLRDTLGAPSRSGIAAARRVLGESYIREKFNLKNNSWRILVFSARPHCTVSKLPEDGLV